jgi:DNA-binding NarL/FixJ family response regulator
MKILVVEDHVLMREALRGVLEELKGDAAVIVEAPDSRQAMRQIEQKPGRGAALLDLGLPDRDGPSALNEIKSLRWLTNTAGWGGAEPPFRGRKRGSHGVVRRREATY